MATRRGVVDVEPRLSRGYDLAEVGFVGTGVVIVLLLVAVGVWFC
jgi:hypothetical protein